MVLPSSNITDRVTERLQNDPRTRDENIDVSFSQGTLTLTGTVSSEAARQAAEEIARDDESVVNTLNELKVK